MKRTALYLRVSSKQQEENTSLEGQLTKLTLEAQNRGRDIVGVETDIGSGGDLNRDGWERILGLARAKRIDTVMFAVLDRATRGGPDQLFGMEYELRRYGVQPEYLDIPEGDDAIASIIKTIKAISAEQEAQNIGRRTREGKLDRAKEGSMVVAARPPYGYTYNSERDSLGRTLRGWYEIEPDQARVVRQIFVESAEGVSAYEIAERLTAAGIPPHQGGAAWQRSSVQAIIGNLVYMGQMVFNKTKRKKNKYTGKVTRTERPESEWVYIPVPVIIDPALWQLANASMKGRRRLTHRKRDYLLSGRIVCTCGARVFSTNGGKYGYYRCAKRPECQVKPITRDEADEAVWSRIVEAFKDPEKLQSGFERYRARNHDKVRSWEIRLEGLEKRSSDLEAERDGWLELFAQRKIDMAKLDARLAGLDRDIAKVKQERGELGELIKEHYPSQAVLDQAKREFEDLIHLGLDDMEFQHKRKLLAVLGIQVIMGGEELGIRGVVSDTLRSWSVGRNVLFVLEPVTRYNMR